MKFSHLVFLMISYGFAKVSIAANLLDVYEDAVAFDKIYLTAKYTQQAELEKLVQSRSNLLPRINATANKSEIEQDPFGATSTINFEREGYGLELRQTLFDNATFNQHKQFRLSAKLANLELLDIEQDLIIRVASAYIAVLQSREDLDLAISNLDAAESQFNQVKERFNVGLASNTEYQQSLSRSKSAFSARLQAQTTLKRSERELEAITGNRYPQLVGLKKELDPEILYSTPDSDWLNNVLQNNIEYRQELIRLKIADKEIKVQRSGHLPRVEFVVSRNNFTIDSPVTSIELDGGEKQTTASVLLSMPIFQGGLVRSRVREAKKLREAANQQLNRIKLSTVNRAQELLDNTQIFKPSIKALEEAVAASQQVLKARQEGFKAGLETNLDVLDAQRDLFQVSLQTNQLRYSAVLLGLQLKQVNGLLNKSDLERINDAMLSEIN